MTEFAEQSGVNRTYISKYMNERLDAPPTPEILKRIANVAANNVTYLDLMKAAGYIPKELTLHFDEEGSMTFGASLNRILETIKEINSELERQVRIKERLAELDELHPAQHKHYKGDSDHGRYSGECSRTQLM